MKVNKAIAHERVPGPHFAEVVHAERVLISLGILGPIIFGGWLRDIALALQRGQALSVPRDIDVAASGIDTVEKLTALVGADPLPLGSQREQSALPETSWLGRQVLFTARYRMPEIDIAPVEFVVLDAPITAAEVAARCDLNINGAAFCAGRLFCTDAFFEGIEHRFIALVEKREGHELTRAKERADDLALRLDLSIDEGSFRKR